MPSGRRRRASRTWAPAARRALDTRSWPPTQPAQREHPRDVVRHRPRHATRDVNRTAERAHRTAERGSRRRINATPAIRARYGAMHNAVPGQGDYCTRVLRQPVLEAPAETTILRNPAKGMPAITCSSSTRKPSAAGTVITWNLAIARSGGPAREAAAAPATIRHRHRGPGGHGQDYAEYYTPEASLGTAR